MNEKCKYCDYVSQCSRKCEYNSILCKLHRSFPKVETDIPISTYGSINVDDLMSAIDRLNKVPNYDELLKENQQLKDNWNYIKKMLKEVRQEKFNVNGYCGTCTDVDIDFLLNKMQELEQGSDSNEI